MIALADRAREAMRRSGNERQLRGLGRVVDLVSRAAPGPGGFDADSDDGLAGYLATAAAAARTSLGMDPFPNQLLSAAAMLRGRSIELATGEGKTLVGAIVAAGYALQGRDVHILTANDYLAARDAAWMGPLYEALGVTCGAVTSASSPAERRRAYRQAVTYASVSEAGFNVLRDRLAADPAARTGASRDVVLLDEADAVLLDEARVPLVLAADGEDHLDEHAEAVADFARTLTPHAHYEVAPDGRTVNLTDDGVRAVEATFPGRDLFGADAEFLVSLNLALYAHAVLRRDVDYVVVGGRVWLVSGSRGRVERLQRWPDGLQLAVEAKERLGSAAGLEVLDQLAVAELIEGYDRVVGMSATMLAAADELEELYKIDVVAVPPHTPCVRDDRPTRLYLTGDDRDRALISLVAEARGASRPVLVACQSVRDSERYAELLRADGLPCVLLNAKNDREEAEVIAQAGATGRITVSTQMAGRGTDIVLTPDAVAAGGLLVVGVGRFPSARLDDQLRGRAGRQGDPGASVFLACLDDPLVLACDPTYPLPRIVSSEGLVEDVAANRKVTRVVAHAQRVSDGEQRGLRWLSWRYGRLLRLQRDHVLTAREECLTGATGLDDAARLAGMAAIDHRWSAHLAHAAEVREGIHLRVLVREDPLVEFEREMARAYAGFLDRAGEDAVALLEAAPIVDGRPDLGALAARIPTATWAYTVTDNSLGTELERIGRGIWRR